MIEGWQSAGQELQLVPPQPPPVPIWPLTPLIWKEQCRLGMHFNTSKGENVISLSYSELNYREQIAFWPQVILVS